MGSDTRMWVTSEVKSINIETVLIRIRSTVLHLKL